MPVSFWPSTDSQSNSDREKDRDGVLHGGSWGVSLIIE